MVELSPELVVIVMFGGALVCILLGYPFAVVIGGVGMAIGVITIGKAVFPMFQMRALDLLSNYILLAVPLFVFMGVLVEKSGVAERLYEGLYLWFGGISGGLAIATILMATLLAATVGVIAASIAMIGLIACPSMVKRGYDKELVSGVVCAGGCLGILIPPSVMLVVYGPMAQLSVGKLFLGAVGPGFLLSALYIICIAVRCWLNPKLAPPIPSEDRKVPLARKTRVLAISIVPPVFLVLAVLGSIFFGIATPTEAAAVGCVASAILVVSYRRFNRQVLKEAVLATLTTTSMVFLIGISASIFTSVFLKLRGGEMVERMILFAPGGVWGPFAIIMLLVFILGFLIDWLGILFIMIPLITPIAAKLGFDSLWFAMMVCLNLQTSFMTPPFAYAIFYLRGIALPEWGMTVGIIIRGIIPFVILILVGLWLCIAFPEIITGLPGMMIK